MMMMISREKRWWVKRDKKKERGLGGKWWVVFVVDVVFLPSFTALEGVVVFLLLLLLLLIVIYFSCAGVGVEEKKCLWCVLTVRELWLWNSFPSLYQIVFHLHLVIHVVFLFFSCSFSVGFLIIADAFGACPVTDEPVDECVEGAQVCAGGRTLRAISQRLELHSTCFSSSWIWWKGKERNHNRNNTTTTAATTNVCEMWAELWGVNYTITSLRCFSHFFFLLHLKTTTTTTPHTHFSSCFIPWWLLTALPPLKKILTDSKQTQITCAQSSFHY